MKMSVKIGIGIFLMMVVISAGLPQSAASPVVYIDGQRYFDGEVKETVVGASLSFEYRNRNSRYRNSGGEILWTTDFPEEIGFSEPSSRKTTVYIKKYSARNPEVTLLRDGKATLASVNLAIVGNSRPQIKVRYDPILSNKNFKVDFGESTSGSRGDEDGDYISEIKAVLKNTDGGTVDSASRKMDEDDVLKPLTLAAGNAGGYTLVATVTDSYGEVAARNMIVIVSPSGSKKDDPIIRVNTKNGSIICEVGKTCRIDTSGSRAEKIKYYDSSELLIKTMNGGGIYERVFNRPGNYQIGIKAYYLNNKGNLDSSRETETTVNICVVGNETAEARAAERQSSSGIGLLAVAICFIVGRKIRKMALV